MPSHTLASGKILSLNSSLAQCTDLYEVSIYDVVLLGEDKLPSFVQSTTENTVNVVLMFDLKQHNLKAGDACYHTGDSYSLTLNPEIINYRAIDALGRGLFAPYKGSIAEKGEKYYVQSDAAEISKRLPVTRTFYTGKYLIDALLPIGKGQRQLLIGDGRLNINQLAMDISRRQSLDADTVIIYVCVGKTDRYVQNILYSCADLENFLVVHSSVEILGAQVMAPQVGCTIAEYFCDLGKDVTVIYDDLTKHAIYYRQLSLLLRENPGREAYPSSVFYLHANLLERAGQRRPLKLKSSTEYGGSVTAFPIVDTYGPEMIGYISTNVISITDGQCFMSQKQQDAGLLPPIDLNVSVSRIGSKAQNKIMAKLAGDTKIKLAELTEQAKFATVSNDEKGRKILKELALAKSLLREQPWGDISSPEKTITILYVLKNKLFINVPVKQIQGILTNLIHHIKADTRLLKEYENLVKVSVYPNMLASYIKKFIAQYNVISDD